MSNIPFYYWLILPLHAVNTSAVHVPTIQFQISKIRNKNMYIERQNDIM